MPKEMFAATPPRRMSRSSTRNDSETLSSWSGSSWSANRPGKLIRWSVAIDPVTSTRIRENYRSVRVLPRATVSYGGDDGICQRSQTHGETVVYGLEGSTRTADTGSLAELIADCREISAGVLPPVRRVIDLTKQVPIPRLPGQALGTRAVIDIRDSVVRLVDGYSDYGS